MLKNLVFKGEDINIIEKANKTNVNEISFMRKMNEYIDRDNSKFFQEILIKRRKIHSK